MEPGCRLIITADDFGLSPGRRGVLGEAGGFEAALDRIGSDYHLGRGVDALGMRVVLIRYLLHNAGGAESAAAVGETIRINRGAQFYGLLLGPDMAIVSAPLQCSPGRAHHSILSIPRVYPEGPAAAASISRFLRAARHHTKATARKGAP